MTDDQTSAGRPDPDPNATIAASSSGPDDNVTGFFDSAAKMLEPDRPRPSQPDDDPFATQIVATPEHQEGDADSGTVAVAKSEAKFHAVDTVAGRRVPPHPDEPATQFFDSEKLSIDLPALPTPNELTEQMTPSSNIEVTGVFDSARQFGMSPDDDPDRTNFLHSEIRDPLRTLVETQAGDGSFTSRATIRGKGRYQLTRELARGGLGSVWLARDQHVARDVALKSMLPRIAGNASLEERFLIEAQITGQLQHPGIIPIYELGIKPDGSPFYTMKLLSGQTLSQSIKAYHALPRDSEERSVRFNELLQVFIGVCNAIGFAHSRNVIHRDLKPLNIMVGDFGEAIVVDWGLAKVMGRPELRERPSSEEPVDARASASFVQPTMNSDGSATVAGSVMGTPAYMSPEQALAQELDARADIFSLGAILYEILSGRAPYKAASGLEILELAQKGVIPSLRTQNRDIPPALEAICLKALAKDKEARYPTAIALGDDIKQFLAGERVAAYPDPWHVSARRWARRHRMLVTTSVSVMLAIALVLSVWQFRERRRLAALRAEARQLLNNSDVSLARDELEPARLALTNGLTLLQEEPENDPLRRELQNQLTVVETRIQERTDRAAASARFADFRRLRDEALFHGTLMTGLDIPANVRATMESAERAMSLYASEQVGQPELGKDARFLDVAQQQQIVDGFQELTLALAEATGQALPGDTTEQIRERAKQALAILDRAEGSGRPLHATWLRKARFLTLAGDTKGAAEAIARSKELPPMRPVDHFLSGEEAYYGRQFEAALSSFRETLRLEPDHFWAHYFLAVCHLQQEQWGEAAAGLTAAASHRPDFVWIYLLRGFAFGSMGQAIPANMDFDRALALAPNEYGIFVNRGLVRVRQGHLDQAIADFHHAIGLRPDQYQAHFNLAEALRRRKRYAEAMKALDGAEKVAPGLPDIPRLRGAIWFEQNEWEKAFAAYEQAHDRESVGSQGRARDLAEMARIRHAQGKANEALSLYDQALKLSPNEPVIARLRAAVLMEMGRAADAIRDLDLYLSSAKPPLVGSLANGDNAEKLDPLTDLRTVAAAFRDRGLMNAALKKTEAALADYTQATALLRRAGDATTTYDRERFGLMHARRGWIYLIDRAKLAEEDFDAAIQSDPKSADAFAGRGYARVEKGDVTAAIKDADTAVTLGPPQPGLLHNAACIYAQAFKKSNNSAHAERAVALVKDAINRLPERIRKQAAPSLLGDPALDPIREHPSFQAIAAGLKAT